jgi:hypothetical protein
MNKLKFGADPEIFSAVNIDNKELVISPALLEKFSGLKFLEQDKDQKHPIYINENEFSWMMDGCAFELTLKNPVENYKEMYNLINNSLDSLNQFIFGLSFDGCPVNIFTKPVIDINPEFYTPYLNELKIYQGFIFGCDEDFDAIETNYTCETINVLTHLKRYAGGHAHISGDEDLINYSIPMIKLLAITVGNFCVANAKYPELEKERNQLYGKPGRYRPQKYSNGDVGIEYRSPSNNWIFMEEDKYEEFFYWLIKAVEFLKDERMDILTEYLNPTINSIINVDVKKARDILKEL